MDICESTKAEYLRAIPGDMRAELARAFSVRDFTLSACYAVQGYAYMPDAVRRAIYDAMRADILAGRDPSHVVAEITTRDGLTWYRVLHVGAGGGLWVRVCGEWVQVRYTGRAYTEAGRLFLVCVE